MNRQRASGFTLVELMISAAIVGILASVAIPEVARLQLRAKAAERRTVMTSIERTMSVLSVNNNGIPGGSLIGQWNPPLPLSTAKRPFVRSQAGWRQLAFELEGNLFYSYNFLAVEGSGAVLTTLDVQSTGDLDGDGETSDKWIHYDAFGHAFQLQWEVPDQGLEDQATF